MVWLDGLSANEAYLVRIADDNSGNLADAITIKLIGLLKASVADDAFTADDALSATLTPESDFMWATLQPRSPSMVFTSRFPALVFAGRNPSITFTEVN
uniref:Uncharacterized protein n=1 Tax=viral metagenome TaxID=1070528 RepID=A0A6M3JXA1_9ZZZZ